MAERLVFAQTDFGGGQVDQDANRREDVKVPKTGARTMSNWRQRNTGTIEVRPGRTAVNFPNSRRAERFRMSPAQELIISFPAGAIVIFDLAGNVVTQFASAAYIWTDATVDQINWCTTEDRIVICFPGMKPQLALWNASLPSNAFSFVPFSFAQIGPQINEPFFRLSNRGVTIFPSALFGNISLTASAGIFSNLQVGQIYSLAGYQVRFTGTGRLDNAYVGTGFGTVISSSLATGFGFGVNPGYSPQISQMFPIGTIAETSLSKMIVEVAGYGPAPGGFLSVFGTVLNNQSPAVVNGDFLVSAWASLQIIGGAASGISPSPLSILTWQQEFMNSTNWPRACFFAHQRLGFCDFPLRPNAILWSSPGNYDVFWVDSAAAISNPAAGASADSAMLEFIEGSPRIRNVAEWNGDEFMLTDKGVYYVPVSTGGQALQPGTVRFASISDATSSEIKPAVTRDALIFVSASGDRISAIIRTGNFTTPYTEQDLTINHSQLINKPVTIAVGRGDEGFPERYIYVLNSDGSVVVGRVQDDKTFVGWVPWTGVGDVVWLSQGFLDVIFNTNYGGAFIVEFVDPSAYLDHSVLVNSPPVSMVRPGIGQFAVFANGQVRVMDGAIDYGLRSVDVNGFLIKNPDDDFSSPTLVGGQPFTSIYSPFMPEAPLGQAQDQRQRRRKITRAAASVIDSNGFVFGGRSIPPFDFGDNPFAQPNLKTNTYRTRPLGRSFDPSIQLIKDAPGPLTLVEFTLEVTV